MADSDLEPLPRGPSPAMIERASPSLWEDLRACMHKAAFRTDPAFRFLRKLRLPAALGLVSHELIEAVTQGALGPDPSRVGLQTEWERLVGEKQRLMAKQWPLGDPPVPERWPGYQIVRVRLLRRLEGLKAREGSPGKAVVSVELMLEPDDVPLRGRVDRVQTISGHTHLIDIKSGWQPGSDVPETHRRQLLIYACLWKRVRGDWPESAWVQALDGTRAEVPIEQTEAEANLEDLLDLLSRYNQIVESGDPMEAEASPSEEHCAFCDYRPACVPLFRQLTSYWGWFRRSTLGEVAEIQGVEDSYSLVLSPSSTNLEPKKGLVTLAGVPSDVTVPTGLIVSVVDASPTLRPDEARATWDTALLIHDPGPREPGAPAHRESAER